MHTKNEKLKKCDHVCNLVLNLVKAEGLDGYIYNTLRQALQVQSKTTVLYHTEDMFSHRLGCVSTNGVMQAQLPP